MLPNPSEARLYRSVKRLPRRREWPDAGDTCSLPLESLSHSVAWPMEFGLVKREEK